MKEVKKHWTPPFIVVPMPINDTGEGPEMDPTLVQETKWEVWDSNFRTVSVHDNRRDAIRAKLDLDEQYG